MVILIPVSLALGGLGLLAFFWALRSNQFEDPEGQAHRVLSARFDDAPPDASGPDDDCDRADRGVSPPSGNRHPPR